MIDKLNLSRTLPIAGIVAFSLCSTWALYHLFTGNAAHPSPIYWAPAVTVELVTAWLVYQVVALVRRVTDTKAAKRDRRFYAIVLCALLVLTIPTLGASIWANTVEFGGLVLGLLFPTAAVACAFALAIPEAVGVYETTRRQERDEDKAKRNRREKDRRAAADREQLLSSLGRAGDTLAAIAENPTATQAQIAAMVGISRRTVGDHLSKLEAAGLVKRNGHGLEVM